MRPCFGFIVPAACALWLTASSIFKVLHCAHYLHPASPGTGGELMWTTTTQTWGVGEQTQFITKGVKLYRAEITVVAGSALIWCAGVVGWALGLQLLLVPGR